MRKTLTIIFLMFGLFFLMSPSIIASDSQVFQVPRVERITVDGLDDDWIEQGFRVEFLTDPDGRALPADDFDVKFRLGWNQEGLLVLAVIRDDIPLEHQSLSRLWRSDCVELFVSEKVGLNNRYSLAIASGADPAHKTLRSRMYDWRPEGQKDPKISTEAASWIFEGGYGVEVLLPWKNLGVEPSPGRELGFQIVMNDFDGNTRDAEDSLRVSWFPGIHPADPNNMQRIMLTDKPGLPVLYRIDRVITFGSCVISIRGSSELLGKPVKLRSANKVIARGKLELMDGRAGFQFPLANAESRKEWPSVEVVLEDKTVAVFEALPTLDRVIDAYIEALGGRDTIAKVTSRKCTGQLIHDYPDQKPVTIPAEIYAAIPDKWRLILHTSKGVQQMGFDGEQGWLQNADRILLDSSQERSKLAYLFNPQGALHLQEYFPRLTLKGRETLEERFVYVVKPTAPDKAQELLYFDVENSLLTRIGDNLEIKDYREEDGVLHPARIAIKRQGGIATYVFGEVKSNALMEAKQFAIPHLDEVFPDVFEGLEDAKAISLLKDFPSGHEDMNVPCRDGRFLYDFILKNKYMRGLEIGAFTGYSALWMGLAFKKTGGTLVTIEIDSASGQEAQKNILKAGLGDVIDARIADAFIEIPKIEGTFDFIFIDAWKPEYVKFFHLLRDRVVPGSAIVAHNVTNYARDMKEFLEIIKKDPGLETTFQELSDEGMSISIVRK
ncbi:MAG: class I SAM-dependent methyltransferase [Candidatus Aminicenantes bacterium]|nr:class I SAM-dependent methyltransferase [Candidatus Aminicenantes bacterium]